MPASDTQVVVIVRNESPVIVQPGPRPEVIVAECPAGQPGGDFPFVPPIPYSYGDAASIVWSAPVAGVLTIVRLDVTIAFNVSSTIKVGVIGNIEALLAASENDPLHVADYEKAADFAVMAGQGIWLEITPGVGTSQGSGTLYVTFVPLTE